MVFAPGFDNMLLGLCGSLIYCHPFSTLCAFGVCSVIMLPVVCYSLDLIYAWNMRFDSLMERLNTMPRAQLPVGVCCLFSEYWNVVLVASSRLVDGSTGTGLFGCDTGQLREDGFASYVWRFTQVVDTMWMQQRIVWAAGIHFWEQLVVLLIVVLNFMHF